MKNNDLLQIMGCERYALRLIKSGLRVSLVANETGLSKRVIRAMYNAVHHRKPSSGMMGTTGNLIRTHSGVVEASILIETYTSICDNEYTMDIEKLISAYAIMNRVSSEIGIEKKNIDDINKAWVIVTDYLIGNIKLERCTLTGLHYGTWQDTKLNHKNSWVIVLGKAQKEQLHNSRTLQ